MIAIDTNVLVRLLTRDNETQYKASHKLFSSAEIFIPDTVILEAEWVLRYAYALGSTEICDTFKRILGLSNVHVTSAQRIAQAISWHASGLGFADALHLAASQGSDALKTFDNDFIKRSKKLSACKVEKP